MDKRKIRKPAIWAALGLILSAGAFAPTLVRAFWDPAQAVHVDAATTENATLAIGTHLIHLSALTDELYEIALESARDSMQNEIYYKSELADGTWFDITGASGLEDITTGGNPVGAARINQLYFEYHTKSDGNTYDLRTGQRVNIFDIRSPYDLEAMKELQPIKLQYDMLNQKEQTEDSPKWAQEQLTLLFQTEIKTAAVDVTDPDREVVVTVSGADTEALDLALANLGAYQDVLKENGGGAEENAVVDSVLGSIDAARRLIVYQIVYDMTYKLMETLNGTNDVKPEGYTVAAGLTDAVNDSLSQLDAAVLSCQAQIIAKGSTILSQQKFYYTTQLTDHGTALDMAACDIDVDNLLALDNITNSVVKNRQAELSLLENELYGKAEARYLSGLSAGENSEYLTAIGQNSARVLLSSIAQAYKGTVDTYRNELQFIVDAKCMRLENQAAQEYITGLLGTAPAYYNSIPGDGFSEVCRSSVEAYIEWLNNKLESLVKGGGGTELDKLRAERGGLQEDYKKALDKNDLEGANKIQQQIDRLTESIETGDQKTIEDYAAVQMEISDLKKELEQLIEAEGQADTGETQESQGGDGVQRLVKQIADKEQEAAKRKSSLSQNSVGTQISDLKSDALSSVGIGKSKEDLDNLNQSVNALGSMLDLNYKVAFPALRDVYSAMVRERDLNENGAYDEAIAKTEALILDNKTAFDNAMRGEPGEDSVMDAAKALFGTETLTEWTEQQQAQYLSGLSRYMEDSFGEDNSDFKPDSLRELEDMLAVAAEDIYRSGNPRVFIRIDDPISPYIPISAIGACNGMRQVWNQGKSMGTLALGSRYYEFHIFSSQARISKTKTQTEDMKLPALFKETVHIPEQYAEAAFGYSCIYVRGTEYGVLIDKDVEAGSEDLLQLLLEGG